MDDMPHHTRAPTGWLEALERSEAQLAVGEAVPGEEVMRELYESIARLEANALASQSVEQCRLSIKSTRYHTRATRPGGRPWSRQRAQIQARRERFRLEPASQAIHERLMRTKPAGRVIRHQRPRRGAPRLRVRFIRRSTSTLVSAIASSSRRPALARIYDVANSNARRCTPRPKSCIPLPPPPHPPGDLPMRRRLFLAPPRRLRSSPEPPIADPFVIRWACWNSSSSPFPTSYPGRVPLRDSSRSNPPRGQ